MLLLPSNSSHYLELTYCVCEFSCENINVASAVTHSKLPELFYRKMCFFNTVSSPSSWCTVPTKELSSKNPETFHVLIFHSFFEDCMFAWGLNSKTDSSHAKTMNVFPKKLTCWRHKSVFIMLCFVTSVLPLLCLYTDCRLCEPAHGGCVHPAALSGHPWEHGAQQPQPLPPSSTGNHRWTAHRAPASVSTHTCTGAFCTLIWGAEEWL